MNNKREKIRKIWLGIKERFLSQNRELRLHKSSKKFIKSIEDIIKVYDNEVRFQKHETQSKYNNVFLLAFTEATMRTAKAILAQVKNRSYFSINMSLRPMVEGMINYKYISDDKSEMRVKAFMIDDTKNRIKSLKRLIPLMKSGNAPAMVEVNTWKNYEVLLQTLNNELETHYKDFGKSNVEFGSLFTRAEKSGTIELYATAYYYLSDDVHLSARYLNMLFGNEGGSLIMHGNLDLERFNLSLRSTMNICMGYLEEMNAKFGYPSKETLDSIKLTK